MWAAKRHWCQVLRVLGKQVKTKLKKWQPRTQIGRITGVNLRRFPLFATRCRLTPATHTNPTHMSSISPPEAARRVLEMANESFGYPTADEELVICHQSENDAAWVFVYNTRSWTESGDPMKSLMGNGPVVVSKADGSVVQVASAYSASDCSTQTKNCKLNSWLSPLRLSLPLFARFDDHLFQSCLYCVSWNFSGFLVTLSRFIRHYVVVCRFAPIALPDSP